MRPEPALPHGITEAGLRRLHLRVRHPVEHLLAGEYRSVFKGSGMDFDELRPYQPGDDVRAIDWNVSARTGKAHVKRFVEERELAVWLVIDASASCRIPSPGRSKWEHLAETAGLLALSALRNNDRVGMILFTDRVEQIVPVRKGLQHGLRILSSLVGARPEGKGTDPAAALDAVGHFIRRRALVFLLSDFQFPISRADLARAGFRQEMVAVAINHPGEIEPPACGLAAVEDSETGERMLCDFGGARTAVYGRAFAEARRSLREELGSVGADLVEITTGDDPAEALAGFFRNRLRRAAGETGGGRAR
jgi:uncharacterized protein (DUF58 family)